MLASIARSSKDPKAKSQAQEKAKAKPKAGSKQADLIWCFHIQFSKLILIQKTYYTNQFKFE